MLLSILLVAFAIALIGYRLSNNRFQVGPRKSERMVVINLERNMKVLGPGTHVLGPAWTKFQKLDTNRNPSDMKDNKFKFKNGVLGKLTVVFATILGRDFDKKNGILMNHEENRPMTPHEYDDQRFIKDENLLELVTRVNVEKEDDLTTAKQCLEKAIEATMSAYTDTELILFEETLAKRAANQPFIIPDPKRLKPGEEWITDIITPALEPKTDDQLLGGLARLIELRANYLLRDLGINIIGVKIIDPPSYVDPVSQKDLETTARAEKLARVPEVPGFSKAQTASANTEQFGQVCQAEGLIAIGQGLEKGITAGLQAVAAAIGAKGGQPPTPPSANPTSPT